MEDLIGILITLGIPLFFLLIGWLAGGYNEHRHLQSLARREAELSKMLATDLKHFPGGADPEAHGELVTGEVVIATDYLKSFLAGLRKIIGGEMKSYRSLVDRARREALVRLLEAARAKGYDAICNVRLEMSDIGGSTKSAGAVMVALFAYGTAYRVKP